MVPLSSKPDWKRDRLKPGATSRAAGTISRKEDDQTTDEACFTDMACPMAHVSAFCRAVVAKVIPKRLWGGDDNRRAIMHYIDQFVNVRKFETLTLHEVTQKLQVCTSRILAHSSTET